MPIILSFRGLRVMIYTNDHAPPHVRVVSSTEHAKFDLLCDLGQVQLRESHGFSAKQLRSIG